MEFFGVYNLLLSWEKKNQDSYLQQILSKLLTVLHSPCNISFKRARVWTGWGDEKNSERKKGRKGYHNQTW